MGTVAIIVIGVIAVTIVSVVGDVVSKGIQARAKSRAAAGDAAPRDLEALEKRISLLESRLEDRDEGVRKLQEEVRFLSRMIEDKSDGKA